MRNLKLPRLPIRPFSENCYLLLLGATGEGGVLQAATNSSQAAQPSHLEAIWCFKQNKWFCHHGGKLDHTNPSQEEACTVLHRHLKQNLVAMRQWWSVLHRSICTLQIFETPSVSRSSRGQMSQGRGPLKTQTCSVTQLSPRSKTKEFTSLLRFFYLGTIN